MELVKTKYNMAKSSILIRLLKYSVKFWYAWYTPIMEIQYTTTIRNIVLPILPIFISSILGIKRIAEMIINIIARMCPVCTGTSPTPGTILFKENSTKLENGMDIVSK